MTLRCTLSDVVRHWLDMVLASGYSCYTRETLTLVILILLAGEVIGGWIDPDTPKDALKTTSYYFDEHAAAKNGNSYRGEKLSQYKLVFSDEFNVDGREFGNGNDPRVSSLVVHVNIA